MEGEGGGAVRGSPVRSWGVMRGPMCGADREQNCGGGSRSLAVGGRRGVGVAHRRHPPEFYFSQTRAVTVP